MTADSRPTTKHLLPCRGCGGELFDRGEETTVEVDAGYSFGGKTATTTIPGLVCPDCDEVTPL